MAVMRAKYEYAGKSVAKPRKLSGVCGQELEQPNHTRYGDHQDE
jgi:hypothetical protein